MDHMKNWNTQSSSERIRTDNLQSAPPVFNFHIHVPLYDSSVQKMYLPRIQPVIHLHFDGFTPNINDTEQNEEDRSRSLEKLVRMAIPKFGKVRFHYNSPSKNSNINCTENETYIVNNYSETGNCETERCILENDLTESETESGPSEFFSAFYAREEIEEDDQSNTVEAHLAKDPKLKRAVVVLTDICKTTPYQACQAKKRRCSSSSSFQNVRLKEHLSNFTETSPSKVPRLNCVDPDIESEQLLCDIKIEDESVPLESLEQFNHELEIHEMDINDEKCKSDNAFKLRPHLQNNSSSHKEHTYHKSRSLLALAQGCRFSDILSRLRENRNSDGWHEFSSDTKSKGNLRTQINNFFEEEVHVNNCDFVEYKNNISVSEFSEVEANESSRESSYIILNPQNVQVHTSNYTDEQTCGKDGSANDNGGENDLEHVFNDIESCITKTNVYKQKTSLNRQEIDSNKLHNIQEIKLMLLKKEFEKRGLIYEMRAKSRKSKTTSKDQLSRPTKKTQKMQKQTPKPSTSAETEDYIPINATGPTKFAVAQVNKIKPFSSHSAKNFKQEMLFGDRVKRFTNSKDLNVYKLKQAARRSAKQKINKIK